MAPTTERIKVVVVDDSVVVRRLLSDVLQSDPEIEVVATSSNGRLGVEAVRRLRPDVVVMDIEMPVMDGIQAVREIRTTDRRTPIIMFSTLTERGARATFDALDAGATDYVTKPGQASAVGSGLESVRVELIPRVRALAGRGPRPTPGRAPARPALVGAPVRPGTRPTTLPPVHGSRLVPTQLGGAAAAGAAALLGGARGRLSGPRPSLLAVGSSTGGPEALARVLGALPANLSVPVVVVQHMPAEFTQLLSERLDRTCAVRVQHAVDGEPLQAGTVVVARGGRHLEVVREGGRLRARLTDAPAENFCRPAVDVMFRSVARAVGGGVLAVVLTGMGSDGTAGAADLAAAGATLWAQDEASSVVWGMPGSLVGAGLAQQVMPLDAIGPALATALHGAREPGAAPLATRGAARA
ncbi:protein-glutamate methylesterase/protein-glutamine glutaminase [Aquipuribacter hungaricus]|uniref:Protein-glutamate methylesterase/protein-glutamine glutaminase n=3 Tax=Aquipuribacter hungaricus TaxID=545624 RepID=A0ABV7WIA7_9MICO